MEKALKLWILQMTLISLDAMANILHKVPFYMRVMQVTGHINYKLIYKFATFLGREEVAERAHEIDNLMAHYFFLLHQGHGSLEATKMAFEKTGVMEVEAKFAQVLIDIMEGKDSAASVELFIQTVDTINTKEKKVYEIKYIKDGKEYSHSYCPPTKEEALGVGNELTRDHVADFFRIVEFSAKAENSPRS